MLYITRDRVTLVPATVMVVDRWGGRGITKFWRGEHEVMEGGDDGLKLQLCLRIITLFPALMIVPHVLPPSDLRIHRSTGSGGTTTPMRPWSSPS